MSRVFPTWPDYTAIQVPPHQMGTPGVFAVSKVDEGEPVICYVPFSPALRTDMTTFWEEVDRLIVAAFEEERAQAA